MATRPPRVSGCAASENYLPKLQSSAGSSGCCLGAFRGCGCGQCHTARWPLTLRGPPSTWRLCGPRHACRQRNASPRKDRCSRSTEAPELMAFGAGSRFEPRGRIPVVPQPKRRFQKARWPASTGPDPHAAQAERGLSRRLSLTQGTRSCASQLTET